jgi:hypothetical protein
MPRLLLMSDAVLRCQRRADAEGDGSLSLPEWKSLISEQYADVYSTVVSAGMRHFESTQTITASGATSYALPSDHDETIGVDRVLDATSGRKYQLGEMMIQERTVHSGLTGDAIAYSIVGQTVELYPTPASGTYLHKYVPQSTDLSSLADTATFDVVTGDGEAFLIYGVAVKARIKLERDPSGAMGERDAARARFLADCQRRALINPRRRVIVPSPGGAAGGYDDEGGWLAMDPGDWRWRG